MSILDMAKDVAKVARQIDNIEIYRQILDLQAEIQNQFDENLKLKQEIAELKEELRIKGSLRFDGSGDIGKYFLKNPNGSEDGPFCSICWDTDKRLVHLFESEGDECYCRFCNYHRNR